MERGAIRKPRKISKLKQTDIGELKEFVDNLSKEQWDEWNLRQKNFFVHKNTVFLLIANFLDILAKLKPSFFFTNNTFFLKCTKYVIFLIYRTDNVETINNITHKYTIIHRCNIFVFISIFM